MKYSNKLYIKKHIHKRVNAGFSLIELLFVIAIIGIVTSIVLFSVHSVRAKSIDAAVLMDLENVRNSAMLFAEDRNGVYAGVCTQGVGSLLARISDMADFSAPIGGIGIASSSEQGLGICHDGGFGQYNGWVISLPLQASPGVYICMDSVKNTIVQTTTPVSAFGMVCTS